MIEDPTRLKLLRLLMERELCVCELVGLMGVAQPTVSQHLAKLRMTGLARERRSAQWAYYSADREAVDQGVAALQAFVYGRLSEIPELHEAWLRLKSPLV